MDKKGQSAVIFIILLPIFLIMTALIVDTGINMYNEKKLKNVTEDVLTHLLENNVAEEKLEEKAAQIYKDNNIDTEYLVVEETYGGRIKINNSSVFYSFMNSLFNKGNGNRQIIVEAEGHIDNNKVIVTFVGDNNEG